MKPNRLFLIGLVTLGCAGVAAAEDASLTVSSLTLPPGGGDIVVVSGHINGLNAFGVTILIELVPRPDSEGVVAFTPAPPVDVHQLGDPWPGVGMFSPFDTNSIVFSSTLNATVDDNGAFLCDTPVTYSGPLAGFPIVTSVDARGIWDVRLATRVGNSVWNCESPITTSAGSGTITVTSQVPTTSTWTLTVFAVLLLTTASIIIRSRRSCVVAKCATD